VGPSTPTAVFPRTKIPSGKALNSSNCRAVFFLESGLSANLLRFKIPIRELGKPHGRPSQPRFGKKIINGTEVVHKYEARTIATVLELHKQGLHCPTSMCFFNDEITIFSNISNVL